MTDTTLSWLACLATVAILVCYELVLTLAQRRRPDRLARTAHANLREEWFHAASAEPGSELLAVQTLRNSMMSATMIASTAVLGLMGTVTLAAPSLHAGLGTAALTNLPSFTPRLALELMLMALLFASLVSSVMAVRYYNHASFICAMPVGSDARKRWSDSGAHYVRRAGVLYGWGLRHLILVAPLVSAILLPTAGPIAALLVIAVMSRVDQVSARSS
jgi:uncharacterized membrane protein